MSIKRIVADLATDDVAALQEFYVGLFDLEVVMDHGWIVTLSGSTPQPIQLSIAREGGSGAPVPDLSIEVEDVDAIHARAKAAGHEICYPLTDEPWNVRRFFLRDPAGKLVNVLMHLG